MPIYLNSKQDFSIPNDFDPDFSNNENFLKDPEMFFDRLPQPFHFINKILNRILNDAFDIIDENFKFKTLESNKLEIQEIKPFSIFEDFGPIQCIVEVLENENYLVVGLKNGLGVIDIVGNKLIDKWENEEMDILSISYERLCQNISILSTIDSNGTGGLVGLINNRLYSLKSFPGSKDGDKPCQVTSVCLDKNIGYVAVCYDQFKDSEQWLEVHKINRDIWIKELKAVGKNLHEYSAAQSDNKMAEPDQGSDESSSILDRNGLRVTGTNIIFKFKYQDSLGSIGTNNFSQIFKQLDPSGQLIGIGLNHCMTSEFVDKLMSSYQMDYPNFLDFHIENDLNLMRIANVRFSEVSGQLIKDVGALQKSESSVMFVWWSQSQHLLIFGLNKTNLKASETFSKPDSVRSFSSWIVTCELSSNNHYLAVGLQNGIFILLDILSGITRITQQVSTVALKSIYFLNFQRCVSENQTKENEAYLSLIDADNQMFCLQYVSQTLSKDSNCVMISNEPGADSVSRLSRNSNITLSIYDGTIIILQDIVTGKKILKFQLPKYMTAVSPWQPICALSSRTGHLCIQVMANQREQPTDSEVLKQMTAVYKIELEVPNGDFIETTIVKKELELQEKHSFVTEKINSMLNFRYKYHEETQLELQESWSKLEEILKTLS